MRGSTESMIALALRRADSSGCRTKVGAVVAAGSRILAAKPNLRRNSPAIDFRNATFHAEEAALRRVRNPAGCVVYVARINSAGEPLLARPCAECQRLLASAGIVRAYYTAGDGSVGLLRLGPPTPPSARGTRLRPQN